MTALSTLKEFKPAFVFLGKFMGLYILGNVLYGIYIESFGDAPDVLTISITAQVSWLLNSLGEGVTCAVNVEKPTVDIWLAGTRILKVFEGCNGINVMIVFIAFIFAFGGTIKMRALFVIVGLFLLYVMNIARIAFLYFMALEYEQYFYYVHKYFFTAILYAVVFGLWVIWVFLYKKQLVAKADHE